MSKPLTIDDYPLVEKRPHDVKGQRGLTFEEITLDAVVAGDVGMEDLRITASSLRMQAEIAAAAGRHALAAFRKP